MPGSRMHPFVVVTLSTPSPLHKNVSIDLADEDRGILLNRLTTVQRNAIQNVPESLTIYNTDNHRVETWNGSSWIEDATVGALIAANNLSDVQDAATARTNLGLGSAATHAATDFDTTGAAATVQSSSLQKTANLSDVSDAFTARSNLGSYLMLFGTGADGDVTISSGLTTLTRDMHYRNLTISGSGKIDTSGWRIFVSGTLDLSSALAHAIHIADAYYTKAPSATGATGGSATGVPFTNGRQIISLHAGGSPGGKTGNSGPGLIGGNGSGTANWNFGGRSGASGNGGSGDAGAAGPGISQTSAGNIGASPTPYQVFWTPPSTFQSAAAGLNGSSGGAGSGDNGSNTGGGSGAAGRGNGMVSIHAATLTRGSVSFPIISALGQSAGDGGNSSGGNAGGGGGSGGGGGGYIYLLVGTLTGSAVFGGLCVDGGNGGNGGNGSGTGTGGDGGQGGNGGGIEFTVLATRTYTRLTPDSVSGSAGIAHSTVTGGSGGGGAVARLNL